jgi:FKBP-type peptidyl-prolyl cis-trans isomerase
MLMVYYGLLPSALGIVLSASTQTLPPVGTATDILKGNGAALQPGDVATVNFRVCVRGGKELADSVKRGLPYSFVVGDRGVVRMWSEAVAGMSVGGERRLEIPPGRAYGTEGVRGIVPPGVTLDVDVWVVGVRKVVGARVR